MLRILATFVFIYLIFRLFTTLVLPWLVRWYLARFRRKFYEQNPHLSQDEPAPRKGKAGVKISYSQSDKKGHSLEDVGEYVDFEEVKEKKENKKDNENKK